MVDNYVAFFNCKPLGQLIIRDQHINHGNLNVMRQSACLVLTQPLLITMLPSLIARRCVGRQTDGPDIKLFILVGWDRSFLSVAWPTGVQLVFFFCSGVS